MKTREYYKNIWHIFNLDKPMVLLSGPRQAGKTTFAEEIASNEPVSLMLNYDIPENKARIIEDPTFFQKIDRKKGDKPLIVLDEIHKYSDWKNYLKGLYDGFSKEFRFLVTGSGRLDLSSKKGDSMAGRYLHYHLYPFTIGEIFSTSETVGLKDIGALFDIPDQSSAAQKAWEAMHQVSGFPEPFISGTAVKYRRWAKTYHSQIIRDDIRNEYAVRDIDKMETFYQMLSNYIGSPFSAMKFAQALNASHNTITSWVSLFERFFLVFRIRPYSERIKRSLLRDPKLYFFDYCRIRDDSFRFENMVAVELNRAITLWNDFGVGEYELWYLRNKEKEEVDFLVTNSGNPLFMVEAKLTKTEATPSLLKFQNTLQIPAIQLVNKPGVARKIKNGPNEMFIISAAAWLAALN